MVKEVHTEPQDFDNLIPAEGKKLPDGVTVRHDQSMMKLMTDVVEEARLMERRYGRADYEGAYTCLQQVMATGSELMKGFGLEPYCKIVHSDVNAMHFTDEQLRIVHELVDAPIPPSNLELD